MTQPSLVILTNQSYCSFCFGTAHSSLLFSYQPIIWLLPANCITMYPIIF